VADEKSPVELRNEKMLEALDNIAALNSTADSRLAGWVQDIRVGIRDRELHHFETEEENASLVAEIEKLKSERQEYAILAEGRGWDATYAVVRWDENGFWEKSQGGLSFDNATILRDHHNAVGEGVDE
jgi:hypothetical protein